MQEQTLMAIKYTVIMHNLNGVCMKLLKSLLSITIVLGCFVAGYITAAEQDSSRFDEELNERDFDALRDFLKAKRAVDIAENVSNLTLSGDVRTEWRHLNESCRGMRLRGHDCVDLSGRPISRNDFDIEFNLYFNYIYDRTWAVVQVRYDNSAGVDDNGHPCRFNEDEDGCTGCCLDRARRCVGDPEGYHGSGNCDDLCLKKAYIGYNFFTDGCTSFDVELGRRGNLYNVFDSNVQFLSRFDGILFTYDSCWECVADWYIHTAGFLVDERVNHFAWVAEVGLLNIADTDIDFKYSFIDWEKHGINRCFARNPKGFQFLNSQWTLAYRLTPEIFCQPTPVKIYGAFLMNHAGYKLHVCGHSKKHKNLAWYAGILIGEIDKEGDWAFEIQYQLVQALALPDDDASGICRGNTLDESFTTCARSGNTNYKGWKLEGLYAITDNLMIDAIMEWSKAEDSRIGGHHSYSKFELETVYAF